MVLEPKSNTNTPVINPPPSTRMISFEQSSNNDTLMANPPPRNMLVGPTSNNDKPTINPPPPARSKVLMSKSNNDTTLINPPPPTQNNVSEPNSNKATTPHVNPSPMSSLSPPMSTTPPFYFNTHISPLNLNFAEPKNFGWTSNLPSFHPNYVGMNPIPQWGSSSNRPEYITMPLLHLGSYQSLPETHQTHNHSFFQFGSENKQTENPINSFLQLGSGSNRDLSKTNPILQPGSSPIPEDKNVSLELSLGLGKSHGSSSNWVKENITFGSNRVQKNDFIDFQFGSLALNPIEPTTHAEKTPDQLVGGLALNRVEPVTEAEKTPNQLDQIRKGKSIFTFQSPVKAKGPGEDNDAGERYGGEIYGGNGGDRDGGEIDRGGVPVVIEVDVGGGGERDGDEVDGGHGGKVNVGGKLDDGEVDGDGGKEEDQEKEVEAETERSDGESNNERVKLWNLRPRKPAEKQSGGGGEGSSRKPATRSQRRAERAQKIELKLILTNEEIEHDFLLMTGQKPPKKPNKRPSKVQKSLEVLLPCSNLTTVTHKKYAVNEEPPLKN